MPQCLLSLPDYRTEDCTPLLRALDSFRQYEKGARSTYLEPRRSQFRKLRSMSEDPLLKVLDYEEVLQFVDAAITSNSRIATGIFEKACSTLSELPNQPTLLSNWSDIATEEDYSIARACIRGMFRDWSGEGASERDAAHIPILEALRKEFGRLGAGGSVRILVPGAGLGRLVHSISELGLTVEATDVSYHTLLTCLYFFGGGTQQAPQTLYPWALGFSNHVRRQDQLRGVTVPDIHLQNPIKLQHHHQPMGTNVEQQIVLKRGGFVEVYGLPARANEFSALATCYFIDTAPNFLDYVLTSWNCLEPGGIWINIGPLLWNIEENGPAGNGEGDMDEQESWKAGRNQGSNSSALLELTGEEVLKVLKAQGFVIEQALNGLDSSMYVGNRSSMLHYTYDMMFWVARKPKCTAKL